MATSNSSRIGANLNGASDGATALFAVGSRVRGDDATEWIYVQANVALTTGQCVYLNQTFTAQLANVTNAITGNVLAFSQGVFAASDFGWVARKGTPIYVLISGVSTVGGELSVSASDSGTLSAAVSTTSGPITISGTLAGISVIEATATATARAVPSFVTYPRAVTLTGTGRG